MRRRTKVTIMLTPVVVVIMLLLAGNVLWWYMMRSPPPLGGQFYAWTCSDSGVVVRWVPSLQRARVAFPQAYTSSVHTWTKVYPSAHNPLTWLYCATHRDPDPSTVFAKAAIENSSMEGLLTAFFVEPGRIGQDAGCLIASEWLPRWRSEVLKGGLRVMRTLDAAQVATALERLSTLLDHEVASVDALEALIAQERQRSRAGPRAEAQSVGSAPNGDEDAGRAELDADDR